MISKEYIDLYKLDQTPDFSYMELLESAGDKTPIGSIINKFCDGFGSLLALKAKGRGSKGVYLGFIISFPTDKGKFNTMLYWQPITAIKINKCMLNYKNDCILCNTSKNIDV